MDDALFVVDNSDDNWKAENYLAEWCEIARQFDIATGYFDISALLTMGGFCYPHTGGGIEEICCYYKQVKMLCSNALY